MPTIDYVFSISGEESVTRAFRNIQAAAQASERAAVAGATRVEGAMRRAGAAGAATGRGAAGGGGRARSPAAAAAAEERRIDRLAVRQLRQEQALYRERCRGARLEEAARARDQAKARRAAFRENRQEQQRQMSWAHRMALQQARWQDQAGRRMGGARQRLFGGGVRGGGRRGGMGFFRGMNRRVASLLTAEATGAVLGYGGEAIRAAMAAQDEAIRLSTRGTVPGGARPAPARLLRRAQVAAAGAPGVSTQDVLQGAGAIVAMTGSIETASQSMDYLAKLMLATGSSAEDLGKTMAALYNNMGIKSVEDMTDAMALLTAQGKKDAFELEDLARGGPRIFAAFQRFGKGPKAVAQAGALTQIIRGGVGTGPQAITALENYIAMFFKPARLKQFRAAGVEPFVGEGAERRLAEPLTTLRKIIVATGGDMEQMGRLIPEARAWRGFAQFLGIFQDAYRRAGKDLSEKEKIALADRALRDEVERLTNIEDARILIEEDAAANAQQSSKRLSAAWEKLTVGLGDELAPVIDQLIAALPDMVDGFLNFVAALDPVISALAGFAEGIAEILSWLPKSEKRELATFTRRAEFTAARAEEQDERLAQLIAKGAPRKQIEREQSKARNAALAAEQAAQQLAVLKANQAGNRLTPEQLEKGHAQWPGLTPEEVANKLVPGPQPVVPPPLPREGTTTVYTAQQVRKIEMTGPMDAATENLVRFNRAVEGSIGILAKLGKLSVPSIASPDVRVPGT